MATKHKISSIQDIKKRASGNHFCVFYQTANDLYEILVPYFKAGIRLNESCLLIATKEESVHLQKMLFNKNAKKDFHEHIEFISCSNIFLLNKKFNGKKALSVLQKKIRQTLNKGSKGIRIAIDISTLKANDRNIFIHHERVFSDIFKNYPASLLCAFSMKKGKILEILEVIKIHQDAFIQHNGKKEFIKGFTLHRLAQILEADQSSQKEKALAMQVIETSPAGIIILSNDGQIIHANAKALQIIGYPKEQIYYKMYNEPEWHMTDFKGNRFPDKELPYRKVMATGKPAHNVMLAVVRPDGRKMFLKLNANPLFNESHQIENVILIVEDITEQINAEDNLRVAMEKAKSLEEIIEKSHVVIMRAKMQPGYPMEYISRNAEKIFGYTVEDFLADRVNYVKIIHPEDLQAARNQSIEFAKKGITEFYQEYRIINKAKEVRWVGDITWYQFDSAGIPKYWYGIISDITARKLAEQGEEKLRAQLEQAQRLEAIGTLAGGTAHDLNNVLTAILGYCDLSLSEINSTHPLYTNYAQIRELATRAAALIHKLLLFSRKKPLMPEFTDINQIILDMIPMLKNLAGKNIIIKPKLESGLGNILVDKGTIEQAIMNLVINAKDAIADKGTISITTEKIIFNKKQSQEAPEARPGTFLRLSVSDTGIGMTPEILEHIFDPFFTTKGVGKGTGLGLSVVYGVIKQHQGWINVSSTPELGSQFVIYLPI